MYTASGGSDRDPVTFGGGLITATEALFTDLQSSTEYVIQLYVIEEGVPVRVSTVALRSTATAKTTRDLKMIVAITAAVAQVLAILVFKLKG